MGISRDSKHKRRATGGKRKVHRKKRKFEMGRPPAMTKIGPVRIHPVRVRGGHIKHRALRLETGNFSWATEAVTRKTRILSVKYNASNNELVRTNTLVKNCIIQIDATPFRQWYEQYYGVVLGKGKTAVTASASKKDEKKDKSAAKPKPKPAEAKKEAGKKEAAKKEPAKKEAGKKEAAKKEPAKKEEAKKDAKTGEKQPEGEVSQRMKRKQAKRRKLRELQPALEEQFTAGRLYACVSSRPGQCGRCDGYILEGDELSFYLKKMQKKKGAQQS